MKKIVFILLFCTIAYSAQCQFIDTLQSVIQKKGSFSFSFNSRNSFIGNNNAYIFGYMLGVCFGKKFTIGGGLNTLSSDIYATKITDGDTLKGKLNFYFFSYFVEYTISFSKHWQLDMPLSIGIGNSSYQYTEHGSIVTESSKTIIPLEPQVELDYNINRFCGISTQVGYRLMLVNNNLLNYNFNSITYAAGIFISPFEIYAALFPRTKLAKLIED